MLYRYVVSGLDWMSIIISLVPRLNSPAFVHTEFFVLMEPENGAQMLAYFR